jgi:hypothetical protein
MRVKLYVGLAWVVVLAAPGARAEEDQTQSEATAPAAAPKKPSDFLVGLRLGYSRALGSADARGMNYQTPSLIPVGIDLAYRASLKTYVGAYGQIALASRTDCGSTSPCTAKEYKGAIVVQYHFKPEASFDPWLAYSLGFEAEHLSGYIGDAGGYVTRTGLEIMGLQLGGDFILRGAESKVGWRVGPFLGLGVGTTLAESGHVGSISLSSGGGGAYQWFSVGARGALDI